MRIQRLLAAALLAGVAAPAFASDQPGTTADQWKEEFSAASTVSGVNDAGNMPAFANLTRGAGPLNRITGQFVLTEDADMYCIYITNPTSFSATTTGTGNSSDTNLALFTTAGVALTFNDNVSTTSTRSTITGVNVPTAGLYFLAISRNDVGFGNAKYTRPADFLGDRIFPGLNQGIAGGGTADPLRVGEYAPLVPGTVIAGWDAGAGGFPLFNANYSIVLTGAEYHMLPAPSAAALMGLGGLVGLRRRRR